MEIKATPKTTQQQVVDLILANYKKRTGQDAIQHADVTPGHVMKSYHGFERKVLVALADPKDTQKVLFVAFEETENNLIGMKTDDWNEGFLTSTKVPLNDNVRETIAMQVDSLVS